MTIQKYRFKRLWYIVLITTSFVIHANKDNRFKIGLCVMATGKYIQFVKPLIHSAKKYFCPNHDITYFVFTDSIIPHILKQNNNINIIYQERLGWPYDTLMRFDVYYKNHKLLSHMDYLFACDADMLFVDYEGDEILAERVSTQHPGHNDKFIIFDTPGELSYENNLVSLAYVAPHEGTHYFAGGFYGGSTKEFLQMAKRITKNIEIDLSNNNYIARYHDESHLNRYFIDHPPTIILDRSYCYPEHGAQAGYPACKPKLLALDKNHDEMRE